MSKRSELPQSRRHVLIFDEDWTFLSTHYGPSAASPIGVGVAVRKIVHARVAALRAQHAELMDKERKL